MGSILVNQDEVGTDPVPIRISDSVLDATSRELDAVAGPDGLTAHARLTVQRSTVFGALHVHALELGEDSLFEGLIRVARRQIGCLRFSSYVLEPGGAPAAPLRLPARSGRSRTAPIAAARERVRPRFRSVRYGSPDYARLSDRCAEEIRRGADDESEMGVFHDLYLSPAGRQSARPPRRIHTGRRRRGPDHRRPGGTMKGDFSRLNLFDPLKQYTRVMQQQGRVQLDADWNEQADILLHYLRTLAADLIGPFGGPARQDHGFQITNFVAAKDKAPANLDIGAGRYYVDGLLCESDLVDGKPLSYRGQPQADDLPEIPFLVYLDVWERHVTYLQDGSIREVALGGADTTTRAQVIWRVRAILTSRRDPATRTSTRDKVWASWAGLGEAAGQPTRPSQGPGEAGRRRHRSLHRLAGRELPRHGEPALPGGDPELGRRR